MDRTGPLGTILCVEDAGDIREVLASFLTDAGYDVLTAATGEAGLDMLGRSPRVDLLFSDIVLPGRLNGFALARQAVALRPDLKVILTTGYADHLAQNEPLVARGGLIPKPYRLTQLLTRIELVLGSRPVELNRVLKRLYGYWLARCGARRFPACSDIAIAELSDIARHLTRIEVVGTAPDLAFRYISVAEVINEIMGTDLAGGFVGETSPAAHRDFLRGLFREVVSTGRPVYSASGFTYAPNGSATPVPGLSTERLFLPLSHGGDAVAEILCGQTFDWAKRDTTVSYVLRSAADRADFVGRFGE